MPATTPHFAFASEPHRFPTSEFRLRVLQLANVARITGGTAACAWTVTRALPDADHAVRFLSRSDAETRRAFAHCDFGCVESLDVSQLASLKPDVVILHNVAARRLPERLPFPTLQYVHSKIDPAPADAVRYCSKFLAAQFGKGDEAVLHQAVPRPRPPETTDTRPLRNELIVGRLCTPSARKWPAALVPFYARLARRFPAIRWEFVGCPQPLQPSLREACRNRARFLAPSWQARSHLWRWDALLYHHPTLPETFGRTAAEAMRAGCIPLLDAKGGFQEQIAPGAGYLCNGLDDFAAALGELHTPRIRLTRSRTCRAHADRRYSIGRFRADLLNALNETAPAARAP